MKHIRYFFEALLLYILFFIFRILPVETASNIGGWLGKTIGSNLAASRKAFRNLQNALPDLDETQQKKVISDMWENLGQIIAEYPHLEHIAEKRTDINGSEILKSIFDKKQGAIFFGAHLSNWEVNCAATLKQFNKDIALTYRAPNNPWSDKLLMHARSLGGQLKAYPKSRKGGKELITALKNKNYVGILIDQKYNEGLSVPFFGIPAMTNPVFVQLCQKYKCPLVPVRNERLGAAKFRINIYEPLVLFDEQNNPIPVEEVIAQAHKYLESWIKEKPGQWLWLHRRWG